MNRFFSALLHAVLLCALMCNHATAQTRTFTDDAGRVVKLPAQAGFEQVVLWKPEVIITNDANFYREVWTKPEWNIIKAVRTKRVFLSPHLPFGWIDYPPGANRLIGLKWLANLLYPQEFKYDLAKEIDTFYSLFYLQKPSAEQIARILGEPGVQSK